MVRALADGLLFIYDEAADFQIVMVEGVSRHFVSFYDKARVRTKIVFTTQLSGVNLNGAGRSSDDSFKI